MPKPDTQDQREREREQLLEEVIPLEDIPNRSGMISSVEEIAPLTNSQWDILQELFEDLEITHKHTSRACSGLAHLLGTLGSAQLMTVLKASMWPLIQINTLKGFLDKPLTPRKTNLPEDKESRVRITMVPNPNIGELAKEKVNSPTCLLAATFAYKILRRFLDGAVQHDMQEKFYVKQKQLATCITGRCYLGSTDRRVRKHKTSGDEPSMSK